MIIGFIFYYKKSQNLFFKSSATIEVPMNGAVR
jgi:hypothetical protein